MNEKSEDLSWLKLGALTTSVHAVISTSLVGDLLAV